jgi:hypothetical protein
MMKQFINILILCVGIAINADAQTFTQRIQKSAQGQGTVTIHQDAAIDELVNGNGTTTTSPKKEVKPVVKPQTQVKKPVQQTQKADDKQQKAEEKQQTVVIDKKEMASDSIEHQTPKHTYKTTGYRIQVFAGGNTRRDRQRAEQAGNALRGLFPGEEVYVHFYSPRWICRMGNYRTYEEAHEKMLEVRKMGYDAATIVKGKITLSQ